jgi:hypothetical protein
MASSSNVWVCVCASCCGAPQIAAAARRLGASRHTPLRVLSPSLPRSARMFVVKRDGRKEEVAFDKITERIKKLT